ncbi:hypothetical protein H9P43_008309 [Blastocladiella emersonii ATCC 22665]|nr:hypothetical protein H9P43_008309 [Blastocladiella emersonii ATCC 22665]
MTSTPTNAAGGGGSGDPICSIRVYDDTSLVVPTAVLPGSTIEPLTLETLDALVRRHQAAGKCLILARVNVAAGNNEDGDGGEVPTHSFFYDAHSLNKILFRKFGRGAEYLFRLFALNPMTNTDILGDVSYFLVEPEVRGHWRRTAHHGAAPSPSASRSGGGARGSRASSLDGTASMDSTTAQRSATLPSIPSAAVPGDSDATTPVRAIATPSGVLEIKEEDYSVLDSILNPGQPLAPAPAPTPVPPSPYRNPDAVTSFVQLMEQSIGRGDQIRIAEIVGPARLASARVLSTDLRVGSGMRGSTADVAPSPLPTRADRVPPAHGFSVGSGAPAPPAGSAHELAGSGQRRASAVLLNSSDPRPPVHSTSEELGTRHHHARPVPSGRRRSSTKDLALLAAAAPRAGTAASHTSLVQLPPDTTRSGPGSSSSSAWKITLRAKSAPTTGARGVAAANGSTPAIAVPQTSSTLSLLVNNNGGGGGGSGGDDPLVLSANRATLSPPLAVGAFYSSSLSAISSGDASQVSSVRGGSLEDELAAPPEVPKPPPRPRPMEHTTIGASSTDSTASDLPLPPAPPPPPVEHAPPKPVVERVATAPPVPNHRTSCSGGNGCSASHGGASGPSPAVVAATMRPRATSASSYAGSIRSTSTGTGGGQILSAVEVPSTSLNGAGTLASLTSSGNASITGGTATTTVYRAVHIGTDDDYLSLSHVRQVFDVNALTPEDAQLFEISRDQLLEEGIVLPELLEDLGVDEYLDPAVGDHGEMFGPSATAGGFEPFNDDEGEYEDLDTDEFQAHDAVGAGSDALGTFNSAISQSLTGGGGGLTTPWGVRRSSRSSQVSISGSRRGSRQQGTAAAGLMTPGRRRSSLVPLHPGLASTTTRRGSRTDAASAVQAAPPRTWFGGWFGASITTPPPDTESSTPQNQRRRRNCRVVAQIAALFSVSIACALVILLAIPASGQLIALLCAATAVGGVLLGILIATRSSASQREARERRSRRRGSGARRRSSVATPALPASAFERRRSSTVHVLAEEPSTGPSSAGDSGERIGIAALSTTLAAAGAGGFNFNRPGSGSASPASNTASSSVPGGLNR